MAPREYVVALNDLLAEFVETGDDRIYGNWDSTSVIDNIIVLHDPYGEVNGCIGQVRTGDDLDGYIEVMNFTGEIRRSTSGGTGSLPVGMSSEWKDAVASSYDHKLYGLGSMSYCVKTDESTFSSLDGEYSVTYEAGVEWYKSIIARIEMYEEVDEVSTSDSLPSSGGAYFSDEYSQDRNEDLNEELIPETADSTGVYYVFAIFGFMAFAILLLKETEKKRKDNE